MNDELLKLADDEWNLAQLDTYIHRLELRVDETKELIRDLKTIRRKKSKRKIVDTGAPRGGK